jgi:hypothetical protein
VGSFGQDTAVARTGHPLDERPIAAKIMVAPGLGVFIETSRADRSLGQPRLKRLAPDIPVQRPWPLRELERAKQILVDPARAGPCVDRFGGRRKITIGKAADTMGVRQSPDEDRQFIA